ncbi:MAG: efflux RND transporter permease subunit [Opitutales bacterium]
MNLSRFFIERPIFATSLSIAIIIFGWVALSRLSISQYPEVVPPTVVVTANYPGANAETVARTVATPIEQEINGVDNMLYMYSNSTGDGEMRLTVTFEIGTDLNDAQVLVQNRVALAEARLPEEVRRLGVSVEKNTPDILLVVQMFSPDDSRDQLFVSNYATQRVVPVLQRISGVGSINTVGARDYAMRIWLDPDKIANLEMTAGEVVSAIRAQNVQVAGGQLAQPPVMGERAFQPSITLRGRMDEVQEFESIVIKRGEDGQIVRLSDVARIELGAENYRTNAYFSGRPYLPLLISQQPGANALETADSILEAMRELESEFPTGIGWDSTYNPTDFFVRTSIDQLSLTIYEAVALVMLVILVFLQSVRASLIPLLAFPVALVGTFIFMAALGYNINMLTLFGLVLAVGIVVDDAIIVVENVERNLRKGLSAIEATRQSMNEISVALISNGLVLAAVFIPTMLIDGISGQFFRQFGVAISVATLLSVFNSLTLSPALSALLLRKREAPKRRTWFHRLPEAFNASFDALNRVYGWLLQRVIRFRYATLGAFAVLVGIGAWLVMSTPRGFIPQADMGFVIVPVQLPPGSSLGRTDEVMQEAFQKALEVEGVSYTHAFPGFYGLTQTTDSSAGTIFVQFTPYEERVESGRTAEAIMADLRAVFSEIEGATINMVTPPTVRGLGTGGGFTLRVQDYEAQGSQALHAATMQLLSALRADSDIQLAFTPFNVSAPDYFIDVDTERAEMLNVPVNRIHETLEVYLGSAYINDFNLSGRTYQVRAQADGDYRLDIERIAELRTRSDTGEMVPLGSVANIELSAAPSRAPRYNLFGTAEIIGAATSELSSQQALDRVEAIAERTLPPGFGIEWTDMSYQERATNAGIALFVLSIVFVFLVLASQYESLRLPFAILLIVPMVLFSAFVGVNLAGMDNNILTQISLVVLVGLAAKNAILIVEFASQLERSGKSAVEAAIEAARLRLRPILMTSFAFILGVVPLMLSTGAGAELRQVIGTTVFSGMLGVTFFGLVFTPVFYVVLREFSFAKLFARKETAAVPTPSAPAASVL